MWILCKWCAHTMKWATGVPTKRDFILTLNILLKYFFLTELKLFYFPVWIPPSRMWNVLYELCSFAPADGGHTALVSSMHALMVALAFHVYRGVVLSSSPVEFPRRWGSLGSSGTTLTHGLLYNTCSSMVGGNKLMCHHDNFLDPETLTDYSPVCSACCSVVFA